MNINFTEQEVQAIKEMAQKLELPEERVVVQALRLYQLYVNGKVTIENTIPSKKWKGGCPALE